MGNIGQMGRISEVWIVTIRQANSLYVLRTHNIPSHFKSSGGAQYGLRLEPSTKPYFMAAGTRDRVTCHDNRLVAFAGHSLSENSRECIELRTRSPEIWGLKVQTV
jgi:hypothetical protein